MTSIKHYHIDTVKQQKQARKKGNKVKIHQNIELHQVYGCKDSSKNPKNNLL